MGVDVDKNGVGEPVLEYKKPNVGRTWPIITPAESDEFNSDTLGIQWQWQANQKVTWSALLRGKGYLRLFAINQPVSAKNLWDVPNLLMQKFPAPAFSATTKITWTVEGNKWQERQAGLLVTGNNYAYLAIAKDEQGYKLVQSVCDSAALATPEKVLAMQRIGTNTVYLRAVVTAPEAHVQFSYSEDGKQFFPIGKPFAAQQEKWIGAKIGLFGSAGAQVGHGGYADFDWFRIERE